ncbi:MAG: PilZ domain-containing protein [Deltaproteobacteria bacterium]|nr:PilZ domain-containing protein [Deltaproteobacteria bacterium]
MTRPGSQQLTLRYDDLEALQSDIDTHLRFARAFVPDAGGLAPRDPCELSIVHPETGNTLSFQAEVVWVKSDDPGRGVGLLLQGLDSKELARLDAFARESKGQPAVENVAQRVRSYSTAQQLKAGREGDLPTRIALERVYGKGVWEPILQNPRVSPPEVSRIARKGNLPKPALESITANTKWLASGEIRRALLSNPRLTGMALDKVLRALPKPELTLAANQTTYSGAVRQAAKKLQGR